ncbi:pentatricopeptide repeat-containing protein DOT4, chloroplastic-like [Selaginella moellendorffii]|uniref:pentatricopeptide repeat-containing protein DOT4, chloroplastic-like n=1 Tax=Selaginella moellendorffii TaxID=88036 RepID=UPI000D1CAB17|nr:pentatricopeptide repeat-containing protein DOT4, chloroplastic-like [Selaginella moellendorffii]|eukprot:XP_024534144.1 pentatricopeptide repeat-containing protein DOT4, chloroplastic-like [Selaginella moellendorffii]
MGYAENGRGDLALEIFSQMEAQGIESNRLSFLGAFKACIAVAGKEVGILVDGKVVKVESLGMGMGIHAKSLRSLRRRGRYQQEDEDIKLPNTVIDMYSKCGSLRDAFMIFERMPWHSVISWTVLMLGFVENGEEELALELFDKMTEMELLEPDDRTFVAAIKACAAQAEKEAGVEISAKRIKLKFLEKGMEIHARARAQGHYDTDVFVGNGLVDLYAKCGSMLDSRRVFEKMVTRDAISWTSLMLGYDDNEEPKLALELFEAMDCPPTALSFVAAFKACSSLAEPEAGVSLDEKLVVKLEILDKGMALHSRAERAGFDREILVVNTLVNMYASCGSMADARRAFDRSLQRDLVLWTSLMVGYVQNSQGSQALEIFTRMKQEVRGFSADPRTYCAALKACGSSAGIGLATAIHADLCRYWSFIEHDPVLATTLLDSYCKCGSVLDSQLVFDLLSVADSVAWTALVAGYGRRGDTARVFALVDAMIEQGVELNKVTFRCVLTACSHAGLVARGKRYFARMTSEFGISPGIEHYVCMIDLLSRANELEAAVEMVHRMPFKPNAMAWMVLLAGCQKWKNVEIGRVAYESLVELDRNNAAVYEIMSNIFRSTSKNSLVN